MEEQMTGAEYDANIRGHEAGEEHALRQLFLHGNETQRQTVRELAEVAGYAPGYLFDALVDTPQYQPGQYN